MTYLWPGANQFPNYVSPKRVSFGLSIRPSYLCFARCRYVDRPLAEEAEDSANSYMSPSYANGYGQRGWGREIRQSKYLLPAAMCAVAVGAAAAIYVYKGKAR